MSEFSGSSIMAEASLAGLKTILLEARILTGDAREAYLSRVCGANPVLREEIESLLAFESDVPSVLDAGLADEGGLLDRLKDAGVSSSTLDLEPDEAHPSRPDAAGGEQIGPYRLVEILGEGGMGIVYRAEQEVPLRREVALKLIRRGLDTDRVVARFDSERQALARMDHPSIARVYDAGSSADGRPYFVMELIKGVPITQYCDTARLSLRERLELFVPVCQAVQHAHQKGVIHRDLKPSNILVSRQDGTAIPKVIDFGIAKAIEEPLTDYTLLTRAGQFIGTPDYMSPEQAGVLDMDVDTRTDVYALGVLLYELLCGRRPHQFDRRTQEEVQQILRHQEPERPSTGLTGRRRLTRSTTALDAEALARIVENRRTTAERLRRQLAGDLDNIVLKAMQKEPARRYGSIEQLANDLQRYLDGRPVLARPDTFTYRTGKFVRRHALAVGIATSAVLLLVAFAVMTAIQSARVTRERDRALAAEQRARTEAETARQVSDFLVGLFRVSDPGEARGNSVTAREILDRGATRITTELNGSPAVRGNLLHAMGSVYKLLGLYDDARRLMTMAVDAREHGSLAELGDSLDQLGDIERYAARTAAAEPILRRALEIRRKQYGPEHPKVAQTTNNLALLLDDEAKYEQAEAMHREALRIRRAALGPRHESVANSLSNLGITLRHRGHYAEAEQVIREAVSIRREVLGANHPNLANSLNVLGGILDDMGQDAAAEAPLREALAIRRKVLPPAHPNLAISLNDLASVLQDLNKLDQAEPLYVEAIAIRRKLMHGAPSTELALATNNLASLYEQRGDYRRAVTFYEESLAIRRTLKGDRDPMVATVLNNLGRLRLAMGQLAPAERLVRDALAIRVERLGPENVQTVGSHMVLGRILHARGAFAPAESELRLALSFAQTKPTPPADHPIIVTTQIELGRLLVDRGRAQEAEPLLRTAVASRTTRFSMTDWRVAEAQVALSRALLAMHRADEAAPLLASSAAALETAGPGVETLRREATQAAAMLEQTLPRQAQATPIRTSARQ
jgi:eukaryotic-like serine/threonine-protein kinase